MLNQRHALYRLAELLDWSVFDIVLGFDVFENDSPVTG